MAGRAQMKDINFYFENDFCIDIHSEKYLPIEVIGDEQRFMQVALNLVQNAITNTDLGFV